MLLDTHVLLWLLDDNPRLGQRTRRALTDGRALHASAASVWEIAVKSVLGKIEAPADLPALIEASGLAALPVTPRHAWAVRDAALPHRDPFDRLLVAQALAERLTLVTADRALLAGTQPTGIRFLDART